MGKRHSGGQHGKDNAEQPKTAVRSRFFRARGLLREALAREIDFVHDTAFSFDGARCDRIVAGVLERARNLQTDQA